MKAVCKCAFALVTLFGLYVPMGNASAGHFTEFVKGQVRQQLDTPQQTPITKTMKAGKKAVTVMANKAYGAMYDHAVQAAKKHPN